MGSLGLHFFEVFPGVDPIGARIAPPLGPGGLEMEPRASKKMLKALQNEVGV